MAPSRGDVRYYTNMLQTRVNLCLHTVLTLLFEESLQFMTEPYVTQLSCGIASDVHFGDRLQRLPRGKAQAGVLYICVRYI